MHMTNEKCLPLPRQVRIVEVGARDGLQNEAQSVSVATKVTLIERLADCGLQTIEAGAFVSPRWVPQMADSAEVLQRLTPRAGVRYPVLTPNVQGLQAALAAGAREVAVFGAASEAFSHKNINCSIAESLARFRPLAVSYTHLDVYKRQARVRRDGIEAKGGQWSAEDEEAFRAPIRTQYEVQGHPYYASARLWDDGVIDPAQSRRVLALSLSAALNAPIQPTKFGLFRM